jgi:D-amino peptidase
VLVSGDDLTIAEARIHLPNVEGVVVKKALGRYAAQCLHPKRAQALLRQGTLIALQKASSFKPMLLQTPVTIKLQFKESGSAESAARALGASLLNDDTVIFHAPDMPVAYAAYSSLVELWQEAWGAWQRA